MAHVQTVLGPVEPQSLGVTLPHEHTQIALWHIPSRHDYWQLTRDEPVILEELAAFRAAGGGAIVDLTLPGVGRDPAWLAGLARASGLQVVMGCGWYRGMHYPAEALIDRRSVDELADELVGEIEVGVGGTGIRPGIIGEIGTDKPWLSAQEERVHRAAARASLRTGLAITTHAVMSDVGLAQLRVFQDEGIDPGRVVIGHADSYPHLDHYLAIVELGATVELDFLGMTFTAQERQGEPRTIELIRELIKRGHRDRILFSQDVCHDSQLRRYGGHGYCYLAETFLPRLRDAGVTDADIEAITVANPQRLLTIG
jgi:predicted metal-dependent phosphotriesterase family hydrolase